jgi:hypothetical protein
MKQRGGALWACSLFALLAAACSPQTDFVGRLKLQRHDSGQDPDACSDAMPCQPQCGAADSCTSDARCADASICRPSTPNGECRGRACGALDSQSALCAQEGPALVVGDGCASATANPHFRYALCIRSQLVTQASLRVDGDVAIDGKGQSISFGGPVTIQGTLRYGGVAPQRSGGTPDIMSQQASAQPSCGLASGAELDIAGAVSARANDNDNSGADSALSKLPHFRGDMELDLPCGRYVVSGIEGDGAVTIHAQGNVALLVAGDVNLDKGLHIDAVAGARITLIVHGAFNVLGGGFSLGDLASARHLLAVSGQVHLATDSHLGGVLYAPEGELLAESGPLEIRGAVFIRRGALNDATTIQYDAQDTFAADGCEMGP